MAGEGYPQPPPESPAGVGSFGLTQLAETIADGRLSSRDAVTDVLAGIEASQPTLNAFRIVRRERALAEADAADRRLAAGVPLPLLGVPIAVKDDTDIAGEPTAIGCGGEFGPKTTDAEVVRRLRKAGAVIVGKTNTCEIRQWPFTSAEAFGHTRSPWDPDRTPGGSSGGSAAAVSGGLVPAALGSDGAGSIRIPAAWTNLVGIKPQRGRISTWPYPELFNGLTVYGVLARTIADAALLLDTVAGNHRDDVERPPAVTVSDAVGADPGKLRIALSLRSPFTGVPTPLHPDVEAGVLRVADALRGRGHHVAVRDPSYGVLLGAGFVARSMAGIREELHRLPQARVDPRTRAHARTGLLLGGPTLAAARAIEPRLHNLIGRIFGDVDVVLAPTTASPPPPVDAMDDLGMLATERLVVASCPYTWAWNVLGWPSIAVPAGFTAEGLPVGAQLMGPANSERLLVSVATQLETDLQWNRRGPRPWWRTA